MGAFLERLGVEHLVVQAGMGGGLSRSELAATVSEAGGLGTIGILTPDDLRAEIAAARGLTGQPFAVNLLLPFARRGPFRSRRGRRRPRHLLGQAGAARRRNLASSMRLGRGG